MNLNINCNFVVKPERSAQENADYLVAFIKAMEKNGYSIEETTVKRERNANPEKEKGPIETEYLNRTGKKWLRIPKEWNGSREEWAQKLLNPSISNDTETEMNSDSDSDYTPENDSDVFHD